MVKDCYKPDLDDDCMLCKFVKKCAKEQSSLGKS